MVKRRTKKYKIRKKNKKTKRRKRKGKKMKGGAWTDGILNFFKGKEKKNLEDKTPDTIEQDNKCPKPKGVLEQINDFGKEQSKVLVNTLDNVNINIKKTAKEQVGRTFNNLMNAMVSKSEKENVCPCCKRPYDLKEKVPPPPKTGDEKPKIVDEKPKMGDEKPKIGDEKPKIGDEKPKIGDEKPKMDDETDKKLNVDEINNMDIMKKLAKPGDTAKSLSEESEQL